MLTNVEKNTKKSGIIVKGKTQWSQNQSDDLLILVYKSLLYLDLLTDKYLYFKTDLRIMQTAYATSERAIGICVMLRLSVNSKLSPMLRNTYGTELQVLELVEASETSLNPFEYLSILSPPIPAQDMPLTIILTKYTVCTHWMVQSPIILWQ